jgi:hypothetical protein
MALNKSMGELHHHLRHAGVWRIVLTTFQWFRANIWLDPVSKRQEVVPRWDTSGRAHRLKASPWGVIETPYPIRDRVDSFSNAGFRSSNSHLVCETRNKVKRFFRINAIAPLTIAFLNSPRPLHSRMPSHSTRKSREHTERRKRGKASCIRLQILYSSALRAFCKTRGPGGHSTQTTDRTCISLVSID